MKRNADNSKKKKVYWKSRKSQPKIAFATLCCIYAVCVQLMLHTWIRIDWCIFEHEIIFIRNIPLAPYSRADPCNDVNKHLRPISLTPTFPKYFKTKIMSFFSFNRQESQHQVYNCPVDREKLERSQVHKTGNTIESGSCRSKCRFISRTRTLIGLPRWWDKSVQSMTSNMAATRLLVCARMAIS